MTPSFNEANVLNSQSHFIQIGNICKLSTYMLGIVPIALFAFSFNLHSNNFTRDYYPHFTDEKNEDLERLCDLHTAGKWWIWDT